MHMRTAAFRLLLLAPLAMPTTAAAQEAAVRDELLMHFETSMEKFIALAEAMPAETYTWSPGEGVMEVGHVYMHVARYNYLYLGQNLDMTLPPGIALGVMEDVRDREAVLRALRESRSWVRDQVAAMDEDDLAADTRLYGRTVARWAVLVQLVAHMNEHLGQSIAYARMNGVVPPWSR